MVDTGALGGVLSDVGLGLMKGFMGPSWEEEKAARRVAQRKAELENLKLEEEAALAKARAGWETRRMSTGVGAGKQFKIGNDIVERDAEGNYKKVYTGEGKPLPVNLWMKDQAKKAILRYFGRDDDGDLTGEELNSTDPNVRGWIDLYQGKGDYDKGLPGTTYTPKSTIRGGNETPPATKPILPEPAAAPTPPSTDAPAAPAPAAPAAPAPAAPAAPPASRPTGPRPPTVTTGTKPGVGPQATGIWADQYDTLSDTELASEKTLLENMPSSPITDAKKNALAQAQAKRQAKAQPSPTPQTQAPAPKSAAPAPVTGSTEKVPTDPKLVQFHRTRFATIPKDQAVQEMQSVLKDPTLTEAQRTAKVGPMAEAYIEEHKEQPPGMETLVAPVQVGGSRTYTVPGGSAQPAAPPAQTGGPTNARTYTVPPSPEQTKEYGRREEDQAFQRREQVRQEAELQLNELRYRLAIKEHDERVTERARLTQQGLEGGVAQNDQAAMANNLFVQGKVASPYYAKNSAADKKLVDDTLAEPAKAEEARKAADAWREEQRLLLAGQAGERDKERLALDKDRLTISQQAHQREEASFQMAKQHQLEGGMHSREQSDMANDLYVQGKIDSPYFARNTAEHKKIVNDILKVPKEAEEARKTAGEWRAARGDIRAESAEARAERTAKLGGGVSKDQEITANALFQADKVKHQYYDEMTSDERDMVNTINKQPEVAKHWRDQELLMRGRRKEHREALKLAQPHLDELRVLDTTKYLTELIVPLVSTSNIGIGAKLKTIAGSVVQYSPIGKSIFRSQAETQLLDEAKAQKKPLEKALNEAAVQARILANVEADPTVRNGLTGLSAQSRLETLSSILIYAHAMATKRGAGGTTRGLIKADLDFARKLFDPELFTKDPDQLLRNLQALQEYIQHARPIINETITSYGIDPKTKRFVGTADAPAPGTVTLTPEQIKLLQPAAPGR